MRRICFLLLIVVVQAGVLRAQRATVPLWVGEVWMMEPSAILGQPYNVSWTTTNPECVKLVPSGYNYCKVTVTKYFSGTESVTIRYNYKNALGVTQTYSLSHVIYCIDNPVMVTPTSKTLQIGETLQLTCTHQNSDYENSPYAIITYSSSSADVATVSSSGRVTAKNPGTAKVYVHSSLANDENAPYCDIVVTAYPTSITFPLANMRLVVGKTATVMPTVKPDKAQYTLTWSSDNTSVAKVSNGTVTARSVGIAKITAEATSLDGVKTVSASYNVIVVDILRGDVNGDSSIDILDVTALVSLILTGNSNGINMDNADVNGDGKVAIDDLTLVIDIILGKI